MKSWMLALLMLLSLLVVACGGATPASDEVVVPAGDESVVEVPVTEVPIPAEDGLLGVQDLPPEQRTLAIQALNLLAAETGLNVNQMNVLRMEEREWPNAALGCPEPDQMYADMIVPGYHLTVEVNGETFEVGTDADVSQIAVCDQAMASQSDGINEETPMSEDETMGEGEPLGVQELDPALRPLATEALTLLAAETGLAVSEMRVVRMEETEWPNAALGCPEPGMMYADMIVPGYHLIVEANGESFDVGTDADVSRIALCDKAS